MLSFASSVGNLFNRLGKLGLLVKALKTYQTAQFTNMTDTTNGVVAQLNSESDIQAIMGGSYIGILGSTDSIIGSLVQNLASQIVNRMVFRDNPQLGQTLTNGNTTASILEIIRQMKIAGATVQSMTVTTTPSSYNTSTGPTSFIGVGNGIIVSSSVRPFDGKTQENSFAENLLFTCTGDSYSGGASAGNEPFSVTGTGSQGDFFAFNWPLGSNAQTSLGAIDGNSNNTNGNLLTNSGFELWTNNVPNSWTLVTGTPGVNIAQESTLNYDGVASLRLIGDGTTKVCITQDITSLIDSRNQYSLNIFARRDGVAPGAGVITLDFIDQNGVEILDANGVANSFTITCSQLTTVYGPYNVMFRSPVILTSSVLLRIIESTAITNGRSVYLDKLSLGLASQIYTSGPFAAVHAGSIPFLTGDYSTVAVTNSRGVGGSLSSWQTFFTQLFPGLVFGSEIMLPSSSVPSLSDSLIG